MGSNHHSRFSYLKVSESNLKHDRVDDSRGMKVKFNAKVNIEKSPPKITQNGRGKEYSHRILKIAGYAANKI